MLGRICNSCQRVFPEQDIRRGRCADCARTYERDRSRRRRLEQPQTRIRDRAQWKDARTAARARDGGCVYRNGGGCDGALAVHHRIPIEQGGAPYDLRNLETACRAHHERAEARIRLAPR
jgi:5-methylcytosine-specific restriction endonuclease McrA